MHGVKPVNSPFTPSLIALAVGLSSPLVLAETQDATNTDSFEKIVVTTQKRVQQINDVPVTISAWNGDTLNQLGISELDGLSDITPGLVIQEQSPNNPGYVIRGITSDSGSAQAAPRVSMYYNGVDISRSRGSYFEMFDLERVEVVKGPQATLFGTAASIGALSVTTNKPQQDLAAKLSVSSGNYNSKTAEGFITGGNDLVQGRLAFLYRDRDGFIKNIAGDAGSQSEDGYKQQDMQGINRIAIRPSLRITPTSQLTIDLVYDYEKNDDTGTAFKNGLLAPTGGDTSPFSYVEMSGSPYSEEVFGKKDLGIERELHDWNLTAEWQLSDQLTLTSITGYRDFDALEVFDADGSQAWFLEFAEQATGDQTSQEFRLTYQGEAVTYLAGINYFSESAKTRVPFSTEESIYLNCLGYLGSGLGCTNADGSVNQLSYYLTSGYASEIPYTAEYTNYGDNSSYSAFVDGSWQVNKQLELTAGLRYLKEDKQSGYSSIVPDSVLTRGALLPIVSTDGEIFESDADFSAWLPRFNLLYRLNDNTNIYATISKGRRSAVIDVSATQDSNGAVVADITPVPAEIVWNYEAGIKGDALEKKLSYSLAVYYMDYSNFQVTLQDDSGSYYTANAGSATNMGLEAEVKASLLPGLNAFANLAYIDATIDDDSSNGTLAGNRFRLQPEWTAAAGLMLDQPLTASLNLTGSLQYSFRSDVFFEEDNAPISGLDIAQPSLALVNAKLGLAGSDNDWRVSLYVNNLFDKEYLVDAGNTGGSFGYPTFVRGAPRFWGIELSGEFNAF